MSKNSYLSKVNPYSSELDAYNNYEDLQDPNLADLDYTEDDVASAPVDYQNLQATQKPYNPYYDGIRSAIDAARKSFATSNEQNNRALRSGILSLGEAIGKEPRERGFKNNLLTFGKALAPAIRAYDAQNIASEEENQTLADKIMAYKALKDKDDLAKQRMALDYAYKDQALKEKQDYYNFMKQRMLQKEFKEAAENGNNINYLKSHLGNDVDATDLIPIEGKQERNKLAVDKKGLGRTLNKLEDVEKLFKEFRESTKDDTFDPLSTTGRYVKKGESLMGRFANNKKLKDEEAKRERIRSQLGQLIADAERTLKGGVLGPKVIEMFEKRGLFPNYDTDSAEVIEAKLSEMKKHLADEYEAVNASLLSGYNIDPYELARLKEKSDGNKVLMRDPETGEEDYISQNRVQEAIADGLVVVNE